MTEAPELLDSVVKNRTFKQLAGYSIKCLQGLCVPTRIGWEVHARASANHGADVGGGPAIVLDVLVRFATDADLLGYGLGAVQSMARAPGARAVDARATELAAQLVAAIWSGGGGGTGGGATLDAPDRASAVLAALDFLLLAAGRAGAALAAGPAPWRVLDVLLGDLAEGTPTAAAWTTPRLAGFRARLCGGAFRLMLALSASREGAAGLLARPALLVTALAAARGLVAAGAVAPGTRAALDPLLRALDRVSRLQGGAAALAALPLPGGALGGALPALDWWLHGGAEAVPGAAAAEAAAGVAAGLKAALAASVSAAPGAPLLAAGGGGGGAAAPLSSLTVVELAARLVGDAGSSSGDAVLLTALREPPDTAAAARGARLVARLCDLPARTAVLARGGGGESVLSEIVLQLRRAVAAASTSVPAAAPLAVAFPLLCALVRVAGESAAEGSGAAHVGVAAVLGACALPASIEAAWAGMTARSRDHGDALGPAVRADRKGMGLLRGIHPPPSSLPPFAGHRGSAPPAPRARRDGGLVGARGT